MEWCLLSAARFFASVSYPVKWPEKACHHGDCPAEFNSSLKRNLLVVQNRRHPHPVRCVWNEEKRWGFSIKSQLRSNAVVSARRSAHFNWIAKKWHNQEALPD